MDDAQFPRGRIFTFYSYKGGVGRSMALANVAVVLARLGRTVLVADWDIEAPGIERYFERAGVRVERQTPGIVDFITNFKDRDPHGWQKWIKPIPVPNGKSIHLLHAGIDDANYPERLRSIDWKLLFDDGLGRTLEQWREEVRSLYDYVLIDSRTGLTDVGGICSILLPDIVIALFTSNQQSVDGTLEAMTRAKAAHARIPLDRSKLLIIPIPARDETNTEYVQARAWREDYSKKLAPLLVDWMPTTKQPIEVFDFLKVPHVPFWSFGERLPVLEEDASNPKTLAYSYSLIARFLDSGLNWSEVTGTSEQAALSERRQRAASEARAKEAEAARLKAEENLRNARERKNEEMKEIVYQRASAVQWKLEPEVRRLSLYRLAVGIGVVCLLAFLVGIVWIQLLHPAFPNADRLIPMSAICGAVLVVPGAYWWMSRLTRMKNTRQLALDTLNAYLARFQVEIVNSVAPVGNLVSDLLDKIDSIDRWSSEITDLALSVSGPIMSTAASSGSAAASPAPTAVPSPVPHAGTSSGPGSLPPDFEAASIENADVIVFYQPSGISRDWLREFMPLLRVWLSEQLGRDAEIEMVTIASDERGDAARGSLKQRPRPTIIVVTESVANAPETPAMLDSLAGVSSRVVLLWLGHATADQRLYRRLGHFTSFDFSDLVYVGEGFSRSDRFLDFQDRVRDIATKLAADIVGPSAMPA